MKREMQRAKDLLWVILLTGRYEKSIPHLGFKEKELALESHNRVT